MHACMRWDIQRRQKEGLQKRIDTLERDPRLGKVLEAVDELRSQKLALSEQQKATEARLDKFTTRVGAGSTVPRNCTASSAASNLNFM